jgi:hypothetical protein
LKLRFGIKVTQPNTILRWLSFRIFTERRIGESPGSTQMSEFPRHAGSAGAVYRLDSGTDISPLCRSA